eukprot:gene16766-19917_t
MIRLITLGLGGEGYLNFMGNEFGHPEWIDFPRDGNDWNYDKCRRRFDLADDGLLRYKHLLHWDVAMHALEEATGFASDDHLLVSSQHEEDKVIVFERGDLVFVFNFHPCNTYEEYKIGVRDGGRYKVCLDSDAYEFAGEGRVPHDWAYFSEPAGSPGGEGNFNNRCATITLQTVPARTVQVYEKLLEGEAEDVSGMPALCRPVAEGGVGFDYRLAMSVPDMWISMLEDQSDEEWSMNRIVSVMCNRRRGVEQTIAYPESHDQSIVGDKTIAFWLIDQEMYTGMADDGTPGSMVVARGVALHQGLHHRKTAAKPGLWR